MALVKVLKTRAYRKRYQTKLRRRREGKTDYGARRRLIFQAKNKYETPKYRLVVRLTNKDVICQIVSSKIQGDVTLCAAYSHELPKYGIKVGLTNYAACYATGLLLARRTLTKLNIDKQFEGLTDNIGENFDQSETSEGRRPFKCILDVGLRRTTTGNRVFAAMKGVCDGGIYVPHKETRFVGHGKKYESLDSDVLRKHLFGGHVADYMKLLQETDEEKYKKQFSQFIKEGITADNLEEMYKNAHQKIRENPVAEKKESKWKKPEGEEKPKVKKRNRFRAEKRNLKTRKYLLEQRKKKLAAAAKHASA